MKHKYSFLLGALVIVLLAAAFVVGRTSASTGCFSDTNGHWAETFICWLKDYNISSGYGDGTYRPENYITRAEMAKMLQKQADVPPTTGVILITVGYGDWVPLWSDDPVSIGRFAEATSIYRNVAGYNIFSVHPDILTALYGKSLRLLGAVFCFDADEYAVLDYIELNTFTQEWEPPGTRSIEVHEDYDYTWADCVSLYDATPVILTAEMGVNLFIGVNFLEANTAFVIGRTTFILYPTDTNASMPLPDMLGSGLEMP
ncbi:MAG: S-layer homology domain-containing protein [Anaerolineales bacterium]|nr:S-layer homology domain-containing protein [Anaerolineales bacterium]